MSAVKKMRVVVRTAALKKLAGIAGLALLSIPVTAQSGSAQGSAQHPDSLSAISLQGVVVAGSYERSLDLSSAQPVEIANQTFLHQHFTGNLIQTLQHLPGVHSMNIGSGFSKPVIRGMGFNRISVTENGIKQEGQQWGADHGLEIDAFGVERVVVRKGPASLLYGGDAMGGVVEIAATPPPADDQVYGEALTLWRSVNGTAGGSVMVGVKRGSWHVKGRFSEQRFGDLRVPTDTVVYLTRRLPIAGRRLKNTAGLERDASGSIDYRHGGYSAGLSFSNAYQRVGFFAGAHGVPDPKRLTDDGDPRDIDMPFSRVNHRKIALRQQFMWSAITAGWDLGLQSNRREEWSQFHTHYGSVQPPPTVDPDKELDFSLNTFSSSAKVRMHGSDRWQHTAGWDVQWQRNTIGGYSFLLPAYRRFTTGLLWLSEWRVAENLSLSGGVRYDHGRLTADAFEDSYLVDYLGLQGYSADDIDRYRWRSYAVDRLFCDLSGSFGLVWQPGANGAGNANRNSEADTHRGHPAHTIKLNLGRGFRLPGANELASNGVHHGTFRHEQGDSSLGSERGWQLDASWTYERGAVLISVTPFASWYANYIYLRPTGSWSILPHAGQIYRFAGAEALFTGAEVEFCVDFARWFNYEFTGEWVHGLNLDEHIPLPFSPPAGMHNTLGWQHGNFGAYVECRAIAPQRRVSRNEDPTPGAVLWNLGATARLGLFGTEIEATLAVQNILNTRYFDHLSFYRQAEIPEPGRNVQLFIKIPFKTKIK
jgi:iron complex outermembrane receptor protein